MENERGKLKMGDVPVGGTNRQHQFSRQHTTSLNYSRKFAAKKLSLKSFHNKSFQSITLRSMNQLIVKASLPTTRIQRHEYLSIAYTSSFSLPLLLLREMTFIIACSLRKAEMFHPEMLFSCRRCSNLVFVFRMQLL